MHALQDIVSPLVALGAIGPFIDFYIGKNGRKEATEKLCRIWSELYKCIQLSVFAKLEATYVIDLFDWAFGASLLSGRRLSMKDGTR